MVPPAGVEPATYRLGGELSNCAQATDDIALSGRMRPINHALHKTPNCLILLGAVFRFGRHNCSDKAGGGRC